MSKPKRNPSQLQDYVLDLLPPAENEQTARQIAADPALLAHIKSERQVGLMVKQTVHQAGQIEAARLTRLRPAIPQKKSSRWNQMALRQMALAGMLCLLLLGSWQWLNDSPGLIWSAEPTTVAVTATVTQAPTATETRTAATETAVSHQIHPEQVNTPAAQATPVAAVPLNTN